MMENNPKTQWKPKPYNHKDQMMDDSHEGGGAILFVVFCAVIFVGMAIGFGLAIIIL